VPDDEVIVPVDDEGLFPAEALQGAGDVGDGGVGDVAGVVWAFGDLVGGDAVYGWQVSDGWVSAVVTPVRLPPRGGRGCFPG
jgi:hypothetical protein